MFHNVLMLLLIYSASNEASFVVNSITYVVLNTVLNKIIDIFKTTF